MNEITNQVEQHTTRNAKLKDHIEYIYIGDTHQHTINETPIKTKQGMNRMFALMSS